MKSIKSSFFINFFLILHLFYVKEKESEKKRLEKTKLEAILSFSYRDSDIVPLNSLTREVPKIKDLR